MTQIKALSVLQTIELLQQKHGLIGVERIKSALSAPARERLFEMTLLPSDWVDIGHVTETLVVYDALMGVADGKAARALVREIAAAQISGVYRVLFALVSPRALIEKSARLWPRYYDRGESLATMVSATHATFEIVGCPDLPIHHEWIILPYTEVALARAGAKDVEGRHSRCVANGAETCLSEFRWK